MSSFKRRGTTSTTPSAPPPPRGTRPAPGSPQTLTTSTGLPSLDDVLGGGLPLGCTMCVLAPDLHSDYGALVQRYFVVQGVLSGQRVVVLGEGREWVGEGMWVREAAAAGLKSEEGEGEEEGGIKIAWRYGQMKKFQTTVDAGAADEYCKPLDLTARIPAAAIDAALHSGQLVLLPVDGDPADGGTLATLRALKALDALLDQSKDDPPPVRICVPSLGAPSWGDLTPPQLLYFLHALRALVRRHPRACASLSIDPPLLGGGADDGSAWGGPGFFTKLAWLSDACVSFNAFSGDLALRAAFPAHHGLVRLLRLPAPHTLRPPSDAYSMLRALHAGGENNLAFTCSRRRLAIATLHLGAEGGVGERRSAPPETTVAREEAAVEAGKKTDKKEKGEAKVLVGLETSGEGSKEQKEQEVKLKKAKKSVAFRSDRPDLYDF